MRTVIVEDVETAEAKKQRLATTAVDAALEILRTEASGLVIEVCSAPGLPGTLPPRQHPRRVYADPDDERARDLARSHRPRPQARVHLRLRTRMPRTSSRDVHQLRGDEGDRRSRGSRPRERLRGHPRGQARCSGLRRLPSLATRALQGARVDGDGRLEQSERP